MNTMSELLARIKLRPLMMIRERRATLLEACIDGFLYAKEIPSVDAIALSEFREWLHKQPGVRACGSFASELIQITGTDEAAFDEFFTLFDQFVRANSLGIEAPGDLTIEWGIVKGNGEMFIERTKDGKMIQREKVDSLPGITVRRTDF